MMVIVNVEGSLQGNFLPDHPHVVKMWRFGEAIGAFVSSASLTAAVMAGVVESVSPDPCQAPSQEAIETVTELFDAPKPKVQGPVEKENKYTRGRWQQAFEAETVRRMGITLPTINTGRQDFLNRPLTPDILSEEPQPFAEYLSFARDVLGQSGIPITVGVPEEMRSDDTVAAKDPTPQELESDASKRQVMELAELFTHAPINLTAHLGITKVALTAHGTATSRETFSYAGLALTDDGVLILDLIHDGEDADDSGPHELYHLIDAYGCNGNIGDDPGYTNLNRAANYAGEWPLPDGFMNSQPKPLAAVSEEFYELSDEQWKAGINKQRNAYCACERKIGALLAPIEVTEDYSYYKVQEDKANLGGRLLDVYSYSRLLDPRAPVLRSKTLFLLARLDRTHPQVLRYYAFIAPRPPKPAFSCR